MSATTESATRLIVTSFAKSRTKSSTTAPPPQDSTKALIEALTHAASDSHPSISQILQNTSPQITHHTAFVTQYSWPLPDAHPWTPISPLRHHSDIKSFESAHDVELIIDLSPAPTTTIPTITTTTTKPGQRRPIRLAVFDMDSTLINEEIIDELARSLGGTATATVSAITARAMNGEIDFATSLTQRVAMLRGVRTTVWDRLKRTVTIAPGARDLVAALKKGGVVTAVVSGGFVPMAEWLRGELGLDYAVANRLGTAEGGGGGDDGGGEGMGYPHLTGQLDPDAPIVTPELKRATLLELASRHGVPISETFCVGDGSNDLLMLHAAGLGVAWNAKERVQELAPMRLNGGTLADLVYLFELDSTGM